MGQAAGDFFHHVDWSRTQAYALGMGGIYLNLQGREAQGIVGGDEAAALRDAIVQGLTGLPDPERDKAAIRSVVISRFTCSITTTRSHAVCRSTGSNPWSS